MCGYFYVGLIDFMLKGKSLLHYTNLFFPKEYEKNDKIIQKYFQYLKIKNLFYEQILNMTEETISQELKWTKEHQRRTLIKK